MLFHSSFGIFNFKQLQARTLLINRAEEVISIDKWGGRSMNRSSCCVCSLCSEFWRTRSPWFRRTPFQGMLKGKFPLMVTFSFSSRLFKISSCNCDATLGFSSHFPHLLVCYFFFSRGTHAIKQTIVTLTGLEFKFDLIKTSCFSHELTVLTCVPIKL